MLTALKARLAARRGAEAEARAESFLRTQGLTLLHRNWRCARGELDLVMADGDALVIVEVRARQQGSHGGALESIDHRKRARLIRSTLAYVQAHAHWQEAAIRFDVVCFEAGGHNRWLRNAFDAGDAA